MYETSTVMKIDQEPFCTHQASCDSVWYDFHIKHPSYPAVLALLLQRKWVFVFYDVSVLRMEKYSTPLGILRVRK